MTTLEKIREFLPNEFKKCHVLHVMRRLGYPEDKDADEYRWRRWYQPALKAGVVRRIENKRGYMRFV